MQSHTLRRVWVAATLLSCVAMVGERVACGREDEKAALWIYRNVPGSGQRDTRPRSERMYKPHFVYPVQQVLNVSINDRLPAKTLEEGATGTVCAFGFKSLGSDQFAGVQFIPGGTNPGTRQGLNVTRELKLDNDKAVYLSLRARVAEGATAKVWFKVGGAPGDGLRFPEAPKGSPTKLNDKWLDISINLKGKAYNPRKWQKEGVKKGGLTEVICALDVLVREMDNPRAAWPVTVYVDDVRFEKRP